MHKIQYTDNNFSYMIRRYNYQMVYLIQWVYGYLLGILPRTWSIISLQIGRHRLLWYGMIFQRYKSCDMRTIDKMCKKSVSHLFDLSLNWFTRIFYVKCTELTASSCSPSPASFQQIFIEHLQYLRHCEVLGQSSEQSRQKFPSS